MALIGEHLSYAYRSRRAPGFALDDVTITIPDRSITGVLGPNGSGKTTLLRLLAGLIRPDHGQVTLDGRPLSSMSRRQVATRIAVVPQETHPAYDYSVLEMVLMGRHPHLRPFELEGPSDMALAREALRSTGTDHLAGRMYMSLSGGEKQRVVIASALAQSSRVLLLDEPTASLDLAFQLDIAALLAELNRRQGITMVLATHDLNLASTLCDRIVMMRDGRVAAAGSTRETLTAATIRRVYDVEADVSRHEASGRVTVVPVGRVR